jgi:NAD(P)-dependent dehydrogenase (short-subunit alcohol dehydrogenase family)
MQNADRYDLTGKVSIITGGTKGIGAAIAERFASGGARVVISSRTAKDVDRKVAELNDRFGTDTPIAAGMACAIEEKSELRTLVDLALDRFGTVTTLAANACGMAWLGPSIEMPDDQMDFQFLSVFKSKLWLVNMVIPEMVRAGGGSVIFTGSGSAQETTTERSVYACMRSAELHLMRNLAAEHGPAGVRFNAISPGLIETFSSGPIFAKTDVREALAAAVPLRRTGTADEIASAAAFLASESSAFTTGLVITVDGGRLLKAKEKVLTAVYGDDRRAH